MSKDERLSAVARRRWLNSTNSTGTNSPSTQSRSQSPARSLTISKTQSEHCKNAVEVVEIDPSANSFESLVTRDIVRFSNFREIEKLNNDTIRIRLSKGQKCILSGRFFLWVKEGVIQFHGAKLEASPEEHYIYVTTVFEIPAIEALTNVAEFEVRSHNYYCSFSSQFDFFEWVSTSDVDGDDYFHTSFLIHGYSKLAEGSLPAPVKEFDTTIATDIARQICQVEDTNSAGEVPTVLICGKQSNGNPMLITTIINSLITAKYQQHPRFGHGVLFLDLDSDVPTFSLPGMGCLIHVARPILGTPFTNPPSMPNEQNENPSKILKMQFTGQLQHVTQLKIARFSLLFDALNRVRVTGYAQCPVIIKANGWLERVDANRVPELAKMLLPDFVLCCGAGTDSQSGQIGKLLGVESKARSCITIPAKPNKDPPFHAQNQLLLQSYFGCRGFHLNHPDWSLLPLEINQNLQVWFGYGQGESFVAGVHLPGIDTEKEDLMDTANGYVVAIVAHDPKNTMEATSKRFGENSYELQYRAETTTILYGECFGLGIVAAFDEAKQQICVLTPVPRRAFEDHAENGGKIDLIAQKVESDGCFDTGWVQMQLEGFLPDRRPAKSIYRRKLNIS